MKNYLMIGEIITALLLITVVLLQARGTGLGATFGGDGNVFRTKRGLEKILFRITIVLTVIFPGLTLASLLLVK